MIQASARLQPCLAQLGTTPRANSAQPQLQPVRRLLIPQQGASGLREAGPASCSRQQQARRRPTAVCAAAAAAVLSPSAVFDAATLLVLPFYAAMIAAPTRRFTQRLFSTPALLAAAAALYGLLLLAWNPLPQLGAVVSAAADAVRGAAAAGGAVNAWRAALPSMPTFAALFGSGSITALAWVHLVLLDLVQARWVYHDGRRNNVPIWHSAVLCFMVGPLGLLCHLATKAAVLAWRGRGQQQEYVVYRF